MKSIKGKIIAFNIFGVIFAVFLGSFLHFVYELSGFFKPVVVIGAVNESTWEHLKIGFWPIFLFAIIEYFAYGKKNNNFCFAKMINLYAVPIIITLLFYSYTFFIEHNLFLDIFIFIFSIFVGYVLSYIILVSQREFSKYRTLSIILIIIGVISFSLLSYFPLKNFLFLDSVTGSYGIIK